MNEIISMFIDDELSIDDKLNLVSKIRQDKSFTAETVELLKQEKQIRSAVVDRLPGFEVKPVVSWKRFFAPVSQPMGLVAATLAAAIIFLFFSFPSPDSRPHLNRFVIYQPDAEQVEITGSFTDWRRVPMNRLGSSGYWEIRLELPEGEHRYSYVLEGRQAFADPTVTAQELDDFGGRNSILYVGENV